METLEQKADALVKITTEDSEIVKSAKELAKAAYVRGAEQAIEPLISALKQIAEWAGNIPDSRLESATGPNDAKYRGGLVVNMRYLAKVAVQQIEPDWEPFN